MKLLVNDQDISAITERITWSGDIKQVARQLEFTVASSDTDYYYKMLSVTIAAGDMIKFYDDQDTLLFLGMIFEMSKSNAASTINYFAFDLMYHVMQSDIYRVYDDTAEAITTDVYNTLGITPLNVATTGITVYLPCLPEKAYDVIMQAYTYASRQTGDKYLPMMTQGDKATVIVKGVQSGITLDGEYNLTDATYKVSLRNLVNRVLVVDKTNKVVDTIEDSTVTKYGVIQRVTNERSAAKNMINTVERTTTVTGLSDTRAIAGYSLYLKEQDLTALFYIDSDTHIFANGLRTMTLSISLDNVMDEKDLKE